MRFSVVVPCYNQERYLTDCLESLACQTVPPWEVVVVDDGSAEQETIDLCARLPQYYYPFHVRSLRKPNGGLASARNHGVRQCTGDVVLPLDADDKISSDAIEAYADYLTRHAQVDICYPDFQDFGNGRRISQMLPFNRWRLAHTNFMISSCAIRRRVFDDGYWYDETMRRGYEDWEFWIRTCALGPFRAGALGKRVFFYRRWGFSQITAVDPLALTADIRARHRALGIWSTEIERNLRTQEAPSHRLVTAEELPLGDDMAPLSPANWDGFLQADQMSRFVWFGSFPHEASAGLQLIVGELAREMPACVYLFEYAGESNVYLAVLDRLTAWRRRDRKSFFSPRPPLCRIVTTTRDQQPRMLAVEKNKSTPLKSQSPAWLQELSRAIAEPVRNRIDKRSDNGLWYYQLREPVIPCPVERGGGRVLAIALPQLSPGEAEFAVRILLQERTMRERFAKIFILTFEKDVHAAHPLFEPLVDAIYHLGALPGDEERCKTIGVSMVESALVSDLLIVNSRHGFEMIQPIRKAGLPVRITTQVHGLERHPITGIASEGYPHLVASQYAALVDAVASVSEQLTAYMIDTLYFPRRKIRTAALDMSQDPSRAQAPADGLSRQRYAAETIDWLFPAGATARNDYLISVFGSAAAA